VHTVTAKIGEGEMGEVYRATDTGFDRDVALEPLDLPLLSGFWNSDTDEPPLEARN
jgi:serine/threonine protein kinase